MNQSSASIGLPAGSIRAGFETAARTHAAVRDGHGLSPAIAPALPSPAPSAATGTAVESAIAHAAQSTSVDFNYLLAQAEVESAMNPAARASTSSAAGLYQFIEGTWLNTVKQHGSRFGLGAVADQIDVTASGSAFVADPAQRGAILALRNDPRVASLMAAGLAEDNRAHLMPILGRQPSHAELYLAHFLGAGGAGRFLSEMQADPAQSAASLFARPAAANRAIFYAPDGSARSLAQVMDVIGGKLDRALNRASDGRAQAFVRADYNAGYDSGRNESGGFTSTPFPIADDAIFRAGISPAFSQASIASSATAALPSLAHRSPQRLAMSQLLGATFGGDLAAAPPQVRRAYDQLKAFGL